MKNKENQNQGIVLFWAIMISFITGVILTAVMQRYEYKEYIDNANKALSISKSYMDRADSILWEKEVDISYKEGDFIYHKEICDSLYKVLK